MESEVKSCEGDGGDHPQILLLDDSPLLSRVVGVSEEGLSKLLTNLGLFARENEVILSLHLDGVWRLNLQCSDKYLHSAMEIEVKMEETPDVSLGYF